MILMSILGILVFLLFFFFVFIYVKVVIVSYFIESPNMISENGVGFI